MDDSFPKEILEISDNLKKKKFSSLEITKEYLRRIGSHDREINSFITVCEETAIEAAIEADKRISKGTAGALTGIPYANKDLFCTKDILTTCGSRMLSNFFPPYDAEIISRAKENSLVMLGKTNMDEFAMGSSNETSYFGAVKNPWDLDKVPGGSSGGSAAAVAANLTPLATGTDTGGSIRQPSAFCGVSGLKPTYGRISRYGMIAFASSLDQAGIIGHSATDIAFFLNMIAGFDPKDSTCIEKPNEDYSRNLNHPLQGIRFGLPKEFFKKELNSGIQQTFANATALVEKLGGKIVDVKLPHSPLSIPAYYVIAPAECSSNLARYDGIQFGHRASDTSTIEELYEKTRSEGFGAEVKRRILIGTYALSSGYYDEYYTKAQKVRRLIKNDFLDAYESVDFILSPTTPTTAFPLKEKAENPTLMYLQDIFTIPASLAGLPCLSIPAGLHKGLPVGLQIIGNYFQEARLLGVANKIQQTTDWHKSTPKQHLEKTS